MKQGKKWVAAALVAGLLLTLLPGLALGAVTLGGSDLSESSGSYSLTFKVGDSAGKTISASSTTASNTTWSITGDKAALFQFSPSTPTSAASVTTTVKPVNTLAAGSEGSNVAQVSIVEEGGETKTISINVEATPVTGITGNFATTGEVGKTITLGATLAPTSPTYSVIEWSIKGGTSEYATLNGTTLTLVKKGSVTVVATVKKGGDKYGATDKTQEFAVTINDPASTVTKPVVDGPASATLTQGTGGTYQFTATGGGTIQWVLSYDPPGVSIDQNGLVTVTDAVEVDVYSITVSAQNSAGTGEKTFVLTIEAKKTEESDPPESGTTPSAPTPANPTPTIPQDVVDKIEDIADKLDDANVDTIEEVEKIIKEVLGDDALDIIADAIASGTVDSTMDTIIDKIETIIGSTNITPSVETSKTNPPDSAIKVPGTSDVDNLKFQTGGKEGEAKLEFSKPDESKIPHLPTGSYDKTTAKEVDIELLIKLAGASDWTSKDTTWLIPITITMDIPAGMAHPENARVLHFKDGSTTPDLLPQSNSNGKIKFTTTDFSVFVIAEYTGTTADSGKTDTPTPIVPILYDITKSGETFTFKTFIANASGKMMGATVTVKLNNKYSTVVTIGNDGVGIGTLEAAGFAGSVANFSARVNGISSATVTKPMVVSSSGKVMPR